MTPKRAACRTCQAPIYWATTRTGRLIPLDPPPAGGLRCVPHWATCPDADAHRRRPP